jgi:ABC-2 type transport system permease protein
MSSPTANPAAAAGRVRFPRAGVLSAIAGREFRSYFNSPIAYLSITAFLVVTGVLFFVASRFFDGGEATLRPLFEWVPMIFVFFIPALSMRLFSEEKRSGTFELLVTYPLTDGEVVLGKFLGSLYFLLVTLALTLVFPLVVSLLGVPDWGPVIGGFIGLILVGAAYLAIGLMTSTWTTNQIVSFILSLVFSSFFFFIDKLLGATEAVKWSLFSEGSALHFVDVALGAIWGAFMACLSYLSFAYHFGNIAKGVLDTRDIFYFLSVTAAALLVATFTLKSRNWK